MPRRLLVVDDEALLRMAVVRTLELAGHECDAAADGLEGLDCLLRQPYALVLTDHRMPRMDGLEMIRSAKGRGVAARFVLISGFVDDLHEEAEGLGIVRIVSKPVMPQTLRQLVSEVFATARGGRDDE
jgi:CheY-like chemotaxis protein